MFNLKILQSAWQRTLIAQKMKFFITDFFSKCDQICRKLVTFSEEILKVRFSPSKNFGFIYFNENLLKMMKNSFYFMLKALFDLEIFTFSVLTFGLCRKMAGQLWLISKFLMPKTGQHNYITYITQHLKE